MYLDVFSETERRVEVKCDADEAGDDLLYGATCVQVVNTAGRTHRKETRDEAREREETHLPRRRAPSVISFCPKQSEKLSHETEQNEQGPGAAAGAA